MLIDRDAALTAVDMDTSMVLPANSKPGSVAWRMRDAALNALRALPAIGTCATCAVWDTADRATSRGGCCNRTHSHELRDHYCAAILAAKAKE